MEFAKLTIDGTEYTLAYDFNEICNAEELIGINLLSALENVLTNRSITAAQLRGLFWAALESGPEPAFPKKTREESLDIAGSLVRLNTLGPIKKALGNAYSLSIGVAATEEADEADETPEA